ncbi:3-oxoacyl-[acyl-carrier protein] reductase [Chitinophaga costaii]|uniref:3-oxoacyl-[acyl-carrier protein] reductase n=1 Tax=Chitinophaga costaii TaxID=1335309 RepID=A0A1C3ZX07_9BACT|nr:SDR family NAD(P)-dependent oxidoreductase [Chitinophaga costaii]PUZ30541.1 SDR family NAD(P)-dependent oxidoreductase [Chitinophaga costaii]SCB86944.1 3-oxoacyl-[acyl-carrier protein] reductase [Chitinophaga costaii]
MKLANQVTLITGAASGIGKAQALLFAREGAHIIASDIQSQALEETVLEIKSAGGEVIGIPADIRKEEDVKNLYVQSLKEYGKINILCNTAGVFDNLIPITETDLSLLRSILSVNIEGTFLVTKYVLQSMLAQKHGIIVNMASDAGLIGGGGGTAYTMSKHAIIGFTKQINAELGHQGIRANAIAPGLIQTPMIQAFISNEDSPIVKAFQKIPAQRFGHTDDIAMASIFLASDDSRYLYGQVLSVDGGLLSTLRF